MTTTTTESLPRTRDALIQDGHTEEEWHAALLPLEATYAMEHTDGLGVYVDHFDDEIRLFVPSTMTAPDGVDGPVPDERIVAAIRAAALAVGLIPDTQ